MSEQHRLDAELSGEETMRPDTRYERFVKRLVSRIHGDAAYSWRNVLARKVERLLTSRDRRAQGRLNAWRQRAAVIATTEAEVRAALAQPRPFYAELTE